MSCEEASMTRVKAEVELNCRACVWVAAAGTAAVTKAVVASWVVFVPAVAVGAVGVPVRAGEAKGAKPEIDAPAGMVTVPVKVGLASGALEVSVPWT
jgi:hypothetical protein